MIYDDNRFFLMMRKGDENDEDEDDEDEMMGTMGILKTLVIKQYV